MDSLSFHLSDIPKQGMALSCEISPAQLNLPAEECWVVGDFYWEGGIKKASDAVYVNGTISGVVVRECVRCLKEFKKQVSIPCSGKYQSDDSLKGQEGPIPLEEASELIGDLAEETYSFIGNRIELTELLREHVILSTPIQPLCHLNCLGLCQVCGQNLNEGLCPCGEKKDILHPFSVLQHMTKNS